MKKLLFTAIVLILHGSCSLSEERIEVDAYFNLDSVLNAQTAWLIESNARLEKRIQLNGQLDQLTESPDSAEWQDELRVLYQIDPNQAEYVNAFHVKDSLNQNTQFTIYILQEGERTPLKRLEIAHRNETLHFVKGEIINESWIQTEKKWFFIKFNADGKLKQYQVIGGKKQIFSDSTSFTINSTVQPG